MAGMSATYTNTVRIGYARISIRTQDHQLQLDALAAAECREVIVETATTRGDRPQLRRTLGLLKPGDTLVVYKPDRVARSMKELLNLLEDQLHAREINLHILTGICAGLHRPNGQTVADKMLFMVAAMAAEMERELIQERTLDGLRAAEAQGRKGGRPPALDANTLAVARARQAKGESVTDRRVPESRPLHPVPSTRSRDLWYQRLTHKIILNAVLPSVSPQAPDRWKDVPGTWAEFHRHNQRQVSEVDRCL